MKKKVFIFCLLTGLTGSIHSGFAEEADMIGIPQHSVNANTIIRDDFYIYMTNFSDARNIAGINADDSIHAINLGVSLLGPWGISGHFGYSAFLNINDWLSVPVFGAAAGSFVTIESGSLFAGSGIIIKNRFFRLGFMGGLLADTTADKTFDFGFFPALNTADYPLLGLFLNRIDGYFYSKQEINNIKIENLNYLLNISFKRFLNLQILELYARNGWNDFRPDYNLSNQAVEFGKGGGIGDTIKWSNPTYRPSSASYADIYQTNVYGLRVGGSRMIVNMEYLTIENLKTPIFGYDKPYYEYEVIGYADYNDYPISRLKGFPSVQLGWPISYEEFSFLIAIRFNTLHLDVRGDGFALPFIPDLIFSAKLQNELYFSVTWASSSLDLTITARSFGKIY